MTASGPSNIKLSYTIYILLVHLEHHAIFLHCVTLPCSWSNRAVIWKHTCHAKASQFFQPTYYPSQSRQSSFIFIQLCISPQPFRHNRQTLKYSMFDGRGVGVFMPTTGFTTCGVRQIVLSYISCQLVFK